ncbi:DUF4249 domain-containing protein [Dyadobacter luticola]|uniref:DUF4249 domain-containing protein n=1 Tax=Dyadobacter luticola TaxID=1979387 RepID=A0A5R9L682_9BACT|nr:DUF4249 domain-containing protein [Dyadobacter luticola]
MAVGLFALPVMLESCIQQFTPPEVGYNDQYLVVDGFFNVSGTDTSRIELRRTQNVNQQDKPIIETGASIAVEGESGGTFPFTESSDGLYVLAPASYDLGGKYRIRIHTNNGKEYLSDYVEVSRTPAIDSLTNKFDANRNSMVFYVNTHDEANKTQFYRWKFEETWEYEATYYSALVIENDTLKIRNENINKCWANKKSGSILLGSTVKLSADVIKDLPLNVVPIQTNKLFIRYSLLVKQYGLSRPAFEYWTDLSKSTQLTGSLFDPQPGKVTGNIHNTSDPKELVFGYFSASTEVTKRLTIAPKLGTFPRCTETDTIPVQCNGKPDDPCAFNTQQLLLTYFGPRSEFVVTGTPECTDCRLAGGTNKRPSFW